MLELLDLWLPIILSAVFVFVLSSVLHMASPMHKSDYARMPGEDDVLEAMRAAGMQRGHFVFPHCKSMQETATAEMQKKYESGPVGYLIVGHSGPLRIGRSLLQWFSYSIVISIVVAYVASIALSRGIDAMTAFRLTGSTALLGYCMAYVPDSIWKGLSWWITFKFVLDGVLYALVTAATFAWLWPAAA